MPIAPNQCTVFVQVWADVNALQQGSTTGCYAVSNRSQQSSGEGTPNLNVNVITGSYVCWSVLPIDPQYTGQFQITGVGAQSGWDAPPQQVPNVPNLFTGQLSQASIGGQVNSDIVFSYNGGNDITVTLPVVITPVAA
jgi:hypothetical protein